MVLAFGFFFIVIQSVIYLKNSNRFSNRWFWWRSLYNVDVGFFFFFFAYKQNEWDTQINSEHQHFYSNSWCPWVSVTWGAAELVEFLCGSGGRCWHQSPLVEQVPWLIIDFPTLGVLAILRYMGKRAIVSKSSRNNFKYNYKYYILLTQTLSFQGLRRNEKNYRFLFRPS